MKQIVIGVFVGVASAIIAWLLIKLFTKRQLQLVIPKLYLFGESENNNLVFGVDVKNLGSKSEDNIRIQFSPDTDLEIVASTSATASIESHAILIDRLNAKAEDSLLIRTKKTKLNSDDVVNVSSSQGLGKKFFEPSPEELANANTYLQLMMLFVFIFIPALFGVGLGMIIDSTKIPNRIFAMFAPSEINADVWDEKEGYLFSDYHRDSDPKKFPCRVTAIEHNDGKVIALVDVQNTAEKRLELTLSLTTSEKPTSVLNSLSNKDYDTGNLLYPDQSGQIRLEADLSHDTIPARAVVECRYEYRDDFFKKLVREYELD